MKKLLGLLFAAILAVGLAACGNDTPPINPTPDPEDIDYKTTFNRPHASYYVPGVPLIEDAHVVYINFDGFAKYYYDEFVKEVIDNYTPTLKQIIDEGIKFSDLRNALPSITNPCQNMILTGSTSAVTKNVYRYYSKSSNTVIQQARENSNKTIVDVAVENNLSTASIAHYLAETVLSTSDPLKAYIYADNTNPKVVARGSNKNNDHFSRFEQLIKLVKGEEIKTGGTKVTITSLPKLTIFYADDLDAVGHNEKDVHGYTKAVSEIQRMNNIMVLLKEMDEKLGEFIAISKSNGTYEKMTFFLTTDHGMTSFGLTSAADSSDSGTSKLGDLKNFLKRYNSNYNLEMVAADGSPSGSTTVVGVGANLNLQLTFKKGITDDELATLKEELKKESYIYDVLTRKDLAEQGYWVGDTDIIITPAGRYCFSSQQLATYIVRGQHDSTQDSASSIYGAIWGKGIKKGYTYTQRAYNYDFGTTMAACLGIEIPNANGIVLDIFER